MLIKHKNLTGNTIHVAHAFTYAKRAARLNATGFVTDDVGLTALQVDTGGYWRLTGISPVTWEPGYGNTMFQKLQAEEVTNIEYNAENKVTKTEYGNGIYCTVTYNVNKKVDVVKFYNASDVLVEEWTYSYDEQNRLIGVQQTI